MTMNLDSPMFKMPGQREMVERINPEGGDIRFRVDLDRRLHVKMDLPLKILEAFRHFHGTEK